MKARNAQKVPNFLEEASLTLKFENTQRGPMAGQPVLHDSVRQALLDLFPELGLELAVDHFLKKGGEPLLTLPINEIQRLFIDRLISRLNDETPVTSRKLQLLPQMQALLESRYPAPAQAAHHAKP